MITQKAMSLGKVLIIIFSSHATVVLVDGVVQITYIYCDDFRKGEVQYV